jgi:hypothetical protein
MERPRFHYQPTCSARGCKQAAAFKIAALWSDGTSHELKNYGLACDAHRDSQLARGQLHCDGLKLVEGESVGPVGLYKLEPGKRDLELTRLPDH